MKIENFKTEMTYKKDKQGIVEFLASRMPAKLPNYLNNYSIASFGQTQSRICVTDAFSVKSQNSFMIYTFTI